MSKRDKNIEERYGSLIERGLMQLTENADNYATKTNNYSLYLRQN